MEPNPTPSAAGATARRAERLAHPRLAREADTIDAMMRIWCRDRHAGAVRDDGGLCPECRTLMEYARKRLALCTYGPDKPTCVNCPIHCYGKKQREEVRQVMRHAGPRMLWRHPVLAIAHLIDGRRPAPPRPNAGAAATAATAATAVPSATGEAASASDQAPR
jgi:hypothetical protein